MDENYISVKQINTYIKNIFEAEVMLQNICVYGEIGSFKISNGIAYFNLQDESGILSCVLFNASDFGSFEVGDLVLVKGSMSYYAKGGKLSFNAYSISPYGKGLLYENFLKLKSMLETKGYFDLDRKKQIPTRAKRIGVVSSSTGAVIQDIIDVTTRRNDTIDIVLYPVKVQGIGAENQIAEGINFFSEYDKVDVVIVARGGGSLEDLQPFNTEIVADAVFNCKKPVVSAVGHETDYTIIDFVADLRAPTPSAAAELVVWKKDDEIENILYYANYLSKLIVDKIKALDDKFIFLLDKIQILLKTKLISRYATINAYINKLENSADKNILKQNAQLDLLNNTLTQLNPKNLALKGYTKVVSSNGIVKSVKGLKQREKLLLELIDGYINVDIIEIKGKQK